MPDLKSTGLSSSTVAKIQRVFSQHPEIETVYLYGSRAKGNYQSGSDIDLTVLGDALSLSQLLKIETELDDLLLPYKIDLCLYRKIESTDLIDHIKRVGMKFYHNNQKQFGYGTELSPMENMR